MKVHEYQAKEILRRYGVPTPRGIVADNADDSARRGEGVGRTRRREGADPRRRPRQRRRREARQGRRRSRGTDEEDDRHDADHAPDRPRGARGAQGPDRGSAQHRQGALPRHHARPPHRNAGDHGVEAGRDGDRGSRRDAIRPRSIASRSTASSARFRSRRARSRNALGLDRRRVQEVRRLRAEADALLHRDRRVAGRDQSADGHEGGRRPRARLQDELRRQRACSATRTSRRCAI